MARILVADDETDILEIVRYNLGLNGHDVQTATLGKQALAMAQASPPDLVILDVMLPDLLGFEVLRRLRKIDECAFIPVILLTAKNAEQDVLVGFELGADDYVTKPFSPRELMARVRAVLARSSTGESSAHEKGRRLMKFGGLELNQDSCQVFLDGMEIQLTRQEYKLLVFMAARPMRVFSRDGLIAGAWEESLHIDPRTVDVHIRRLRARIEKNPAQPVYLETVRGSGYRFNPGPRPQEGK
ncbi:MAG: response regulator transcription factor [Nitrospinota bacterium]|nr:response regulator transcription factor [Nitrospinota bacterium]